MQAQTAERVLKVADHIISTHQTVRQAAPYFNVTHATIHEDITKRLIELDIDKYEKCQTILAKNLESGRSNKDGYKTANYWAENKDEREATALEIADYIIKTKQTRKQVAEHFSIHWTLVTYIVHKLEKIDYNKYQQCKLILAEHKEKGRKNGGIRRNNKLL